MPSAKERLTHLLALAEKGPALRAALAEEVTDLLLDWPDDCPDAMRRPCEILLERITCEADGDMRTRLAQRIADVSELPTPLLNALFFVASRTQKEKIIARNQDSDLPVDGLRADEAALIDAARTNSGFTGAFARLFHISDETARDVLIDSSGQSLALVCKGAHVSRAAFSALAVLTAKDASGVLLETYETVPQRAAERMLSNWRLQQSHLRTAAE